MGEYEPPPAYEIENQLCDMNFELTCFLNKFENFRKTKVIDNNLCKNFGNLIENIESYLDSEPTEMPCPALSDVQFDLDNHRIKKVFYCSLCEVNVKDRAFAINKHLKTRKHIATLSMLQNGDIGSEEILRNGGASIEAALQKKIREEKLKQRKEKKNRIDERRTLPKKMAAFIKGNFYNYLVDSSNNAKKLMHIPAYEELRKTLMKVIGQAYPNVKVYYFGSRLSGLGNVDSDLDIYIDVDDNYNKYTTGDDGTKYIKIVRKLLEAESDEWKCFNAILSARIPILRVYNHKLRIDCDINFSNSLGECNTQLTKYFFEIQPIGQKICLFVKKWVRVSSFSESFTTYTLVLMVIFHLQQQNYLPSVQYLQKDIDPNLIGPWQGNFARLQLTDLGIKKIPDTPEQLLRQLILFFGACAEYNYANLIICPYTGTSIERKEFISSKICPRYARFREKCSENELINLTKPICVQDPLELNHNVAKGVILSNLMLFRHFCKLTVKELKERENTS